MFAQLKYSSRLNLDQRLTALAINTAVNLVFFVLGVMGALPIGWITTGVVLSSLGLFALLIANVIADFESIKSLFAAPSGYNVMLTPVPGWKVILGRLIPMTVFDIIAYTLGILGVILQSSLLSGRPGAHSYGVIGVIPSGESVLSMIGGVIGYFSLLALIIFACAFAKSILFPLRGRGILALAAALVLIYASSWLDLILFPFAEVVRYGAFFSVNIVVGWNAGAIGYLILMLVKTAALVIGASYLYERKVNL